MSNSQFLMFSENKDDSSLGRARSMTKTLEKKGKAPIVPTTSINSEFAQVVNRLKQLQEEWTKRRMTRKVPIITLKYSDQNELLDAHHQIEALKTDKKQLTTTVSSLFKEMQHLKEQNQNMAERIESLRKVLHVSKSYTISLKQRNDNLASDMDFQSDLHEKQRRVWKTKIRTSVYDGPNSSSSNNKNQNAFQKMNSINIAESNDLDKLIREYESTIEKQREEIIHRDQQLEQQKAVFEYEKNQQYAELTKEINQLKNQRQQEIEELKLKIEQHHTELEQRKQENGRLHKTLEVTNNELNANRKLIEASRPTNATQTEQQLFQLEQDYLNLSEVLVACQHRVTKIENELDEKQHELDDANRLIDEQNKTMEEYKKSIQLLQANLAESKSDQSDLINALQQEWEQCKQELMRYKQKCRQLIHEKDELIAQNVARNGLQSLNLQTANQIGTPTTPHKFNNSWGVGDFQAAQPIKLGSNNHNMANAEMVVQLHELQRKLQQKEDEVKSQEMLMKQLMEQQKAFQKRNKTLVARLKAIKKHNNLSGNFNINEGDFTWFNGPAPENVTVDMKKLYDHYVRNPMIQTAEIINKIRMKSSDLGKNGDGSNDYIIPEFNGKIRINSASVILYVFEDILVQRQQAISLCNDKISEILRLKEQHERHNEKGEIDKKRFYGDIRKLKDQLLKYQYQIHEMEEKQLLSFDTDDKYDDLVLELERLKKENERIAQEFLQGANVWNAEKAIMSAERAQIENDISYIAHNLEQLILERQQFEEEADQFQGLYVNLIAHLREKGMQIEVEYIDHNNVNSHYTQVAIKDDNFISQRRKRNTMRLKLYQATTQPAALREIDEDTVSSSHISKDNSKSLHANNSNNRNNSKKQKSSGLKLYGKRKNESIDNIFDPNTKSNTNVVVSGNTNAKDADRKPSLWKRVSAQKKSRDRGKDRDNKQVMNSEDLMSDLQIPTSPRSSSSQQSRDEHGGGSVVGSALNIEDEADAYIPFDEPDEFNLLDYEYRKLAMKFVSENDTFMNSQTIDVDAISGNADLNLMAQEVLSQELRRNQEKLPILQGWIEKKSPTFARGWQKRWVIVKEYNIFYGKTKTDIKDTKNEQERKKFLNAIPLLVVQYIVGTDHSRSGRKFEIVARDPRTGDRRHYQWKAATREECDKWVHGLNAHKKLLAARLQFLANTGDTDNHI